MAKLYGIGVGPGDKDLISQRAIGVLDHVDVIFTPISKMGRKSVALGIAEDYIPETTRIEEREFPSTRERSITRPLWQAIIKEIEEEIDRGNNVAFITLGDPSTYSTYSYLVKHMEEGYDVETIAGITSYQHISSIFNRPLVLDDEALAVVPATADEGKIRAALENFDTIVLMKISRHLAKVLPILEDLGLEDSFVIVSEASRERENVIYPEDLDPQGKLPYFSTMMVYKSRWRDESEG